MVRSLAIQVKVLDRPGSPQGPVEISGLTAEKCVISWKPPTLDGGAPVTNYIVDKRETSHLAWVLVNPNVEGTICRIGMFYLAARLASKSIFTSIMQISYTCFRYQVNFQFIRYSLGKLLASNEYIFRVRAENKYGVGNALESSATVAKNPFTCPSSPGTPEVTSVTMNSVTLAWTRPKSDGGAEISQYIIEKRQRNGTRWIRFAIAPISYFFHIRNWM